MKANITFTQEEMRKALINYIESELGIYNQDWEIKIEVKSKQNYRSEWEEAEFRGELTASK